MRGLVWFVLGLSLLSTARSDDSTEDPEHDGELGANHAAEQIDIAHGLTHDYRLENDPECVLLVATDNEPTKYHLDVSEYSICNDYVNEVWGECNCPEGQRCEYEGAVVESRSYYCREIEGSPSAANNFGNGLVLGELEEARVYF